MRLELDSNQISLVNKIEWDIGLHRIKGPAGSGKSHVLAARAAKLANEGKSVLVSTFNITLWHYLLDLIVRELDKLDRINNIEFVNFHLWCKYVCHEAGLEERYKKLWKLGKQKKDTLEHTLNISLLNLVEEAIEHPNVRKFDAILVDEAQDYRLEWWNILRKACNPNGGMLLVADATQDVYGTAKSWTDDVMKGAGFLGPWAQLDVSYRMPRDAMYLAQDFATNYLDEDIPDIRQMSLDIEPCCLRWVQCSRKEVGEKCLNEVISLMKNTGKNNLANTDITILVDNMKCGAGIVNLLSKEGIQVIDTFGNDHRRKKMAFFMGDGRIKATTLHSFKGWESRIIVIYITNDVYEENLPLIYAGLTRLKRHVDGSWLTVVCCEPYFKHFGKKFPDYDPPASQ